MSRPKSIKIVCKSCGYTGTGISKNNDMLYNIPNCSHHSKDKEFKVKIHLK